MIILHICPSGPFTDGWGYQENLLAKQQSLEGHKVIILATTKMHLADGSVILLLKSMIMKELE